MKLLSLLPLAVLVGCDSGPSKEESVQIYASASSSLATAQGAAVAQAGDGNVTLDYSGACALGGTVGLAGGYSDGGTTGDATFDLHATFSACNGGVGTISGDLHWAATVTDTSVTTSMKGDLDWEGRDGSGSCHFDMEIIVSEALYSFKGSLCGYDVGSELSLTPPDGI